MCEGDAALGRGGGGGRLDELALAGLERPIPKPGTDTPAAPRRLMAPWLRIPLAEEPAELPEFVLGGSRGGKLGGPGFVPATAD